MTSSFPLLNLPSDAILHVLKSMDYEEFIAISFLSKRAKQSVELMNLYCRKAFALISNPIRLFMCFDEAGVELSFTVNNVSEEQTNGSLSLMKKMELEIYINELVKVELSMNEVCIEKCIDHFNAVFHFSELNCLQFHENVSRFDIKELRTMFNSYDVLRISSDNGSDLKSILKHFPTRRLFFDNDVFNNLENPYRVLIQNYDKLVIDPDMESPNTLQFDDLLIINSKTIEIYNMNWAEKELNRFLKHWRKGSNPRMEKLSIHFFSLTLTTLFEILKGIKYVEMPAEHTRWFKSCKGAFETVRGGHDFNRCDGTKATIIIPAFTTHMVIIENARILQQHSASSPSSFSFIPIIPSTVMTSSFPLLNLPPEAILNVLKSMYYGEFINLSLLSERAKRAVESMNLNYRYSFAIISNSISLVIHFKATRLELRFTMNEIRENRTNDFLSLPDKVELRISTINSLEIKYMKRICVKEWINHFNAVFHFSTFDCLNFGENASRFDMKELQTMFCSYDKLCIVRDNGSDVKSILKHFPTRRLSFDNDVFKRLENPSSLLIQNYDGLAIDPEPESPNTLELDDLLTTNSKTVYIYSLNWTEKEVNRFLKHWMKGCNPRLEKLYIDFCSLEVVSKSDIFKGIKYMEMPAEHTRWFKFFEGAVEAVNGGYDFYRCDGTKATLTFRSLGICSMLEMHVWYPHCVVEVREIEN